jgi:hypothetical protein
VGIGIRVSGSSALMEGVQPCIYSLGVEYEPMDQTDMRYGGGRLWKLVGVSHRGSRAAWGWERLGPPGKVSYTASMWCPLVSSRTFLHSSHEIIPRSLLIFRSSLAVFCVNPVKNINSPKLMQTISLNLLFYDIHPF